MLIRYNIKYFSYFSLSGNNLVSYNHYLPLALKYYCYNLIT